MIEPYYQHAGITIYHGDCREILPELEPVDLVLTDPPYGIGESRNDNGSRGLLAVPKNYPIESWDDEAPQWFADMMPFGKNHIIWGGNYFDLPPQSKWLIWDKINGKTDFADCEMAWTDLQGATRLIQHQWNGMMRVGKEHRQHRTQKPRNLMRWCIQEAGEPQTILDPFMGSGTTLRAAKDLGRQAIGIEIEEKYCEIAANRLRQEVLAF